MTVPNESDSDDHRDCPDHPAGIGPGIVVAVSDRRDHDYSPPECFDPSADVGAWRILLDPKHKHASELESHDGKEDSEE